MALISVPTTSDGHTSDKCQTCDETNLITANPAAKKSTEGVSLENALPITNQQNQAPEKPPRFTLEDLLSDDFKQPSDYHWYFLRVSYNRAEKLYNELKDRNDGYFLWMPCSKKVKYLEGKKYETLVPIFKSNIFIYSTREIALSLTKRAGDTGYSYVDFAFDHTAQKEFGRDPAITIPFAEMKNFIKAENVHHPWAHVVTEEQITYRPGGLVRVTDGSFAGVVGRVARVFGQTRIVISIKGILKYATAYVSMKHVEPYVAPDHEDQAVHSPEVRLEESRQRLAAKIKKKKSKKS